MTEFLASALYALGPGLFLNLVIAELILVSRPNLYPPFTFLY